MIILILPYIPKIGISKILFGGNILFNIIDLDNYAAEDALMFLITSPKSLRGYQIENSHFTIFNVIDTSGNNNFLMICKPYHEVTNWRLEIYDILFYAKTCKLFLNLLKNVYDFTFDCILLFRNFNTILEIKSISYDYVYFR